MGASNGRRLSLGLGISSTVLGGNGAARRKIRIPGCLTLHGCASLKAVATHALGIGIGLEDPNSGELAEEFLEATQAIGGPFLEHLEDQVVKFAGDFLVMSRQRGGALLDVLV